MESEAVKSAENSSAISLWRGWLNPYEAAVTRGAVAFDEAALIADITAFGQSQTGNAFRNDALGRLKQALAEMRDRLKEELEASHDGARYVGAHALSMDRLIRIITDHVALPLFEESVAVSAASSAESGRFAVMAIGGYGRGEMAPYSLSLIHI